MTTLRLLLVLVASFALTACGSPVFDCNTAVEPLVSGTVVSAQTGEALNLPFEVVARLDGELVEASTVGSQFSVSPSVEGRNDDATVALEVTAEGYQPWTQTVTVEFGTCGARTVEVQVELEVASGSSM